MELTEATEMCPHCQNEVTVQWNVEKDGYELYCPNCGKHFTGTGIAEFCYHCGQRLKWEK